MGRPECTQSCVVLPRSVGGLIVGKGGWRLREIETTFNLQVCYVAKQGGAQYLVCEGRAIDVQAAQASIKHTIAQALSTTGSQRTYLYVYRYDGPSLPGAVQLHYINTIHGHTQRTNDHARPMRRARLAGVKSVAFANELRATQPYVHAVFARLPKMTTDLRIGAILGKNFKVASSYRGATVSAAEWASLHATTQDYFNRYMLHTERAHAVRMWATEQGYVHTQVALHALQYRRFADAPSYKTLFKKRCGAPKLPSSSFRVLKPTRAVGKPSAGLASTIGVIASSSAKVDFQLTFRAKPATTATPKAKAPPAAKTAAKSCQESRPEKVLFQIVERWSNGDYTISIEQKPSSTMAPSPSTDLWAVHVAPSSAAIAAMCSSRDAFAAGVYSLEAVATAIVDVVG
ncbi:hypothetical protein SPRG_10796 [Saprolegnia parasitica CBS 223.65]|uniref:K Homology domain-containing protein n=1 Tax=Saprolegnia parasitica (strain CBS 223.65) TaxID=695850 RepID=A0A067CAN6_SAPPC|nr:hypothetical protein SPRG_10796 [Saprolegnia parasitica CBS 223.65]KDO23601.1 hypothetical protein SPRG_10796 [Saprolegnia parasitica CBS 223.65]|eukprot:XP_012205749.1 hypothetical protein SPRG_10796 [Saprolegnia parasitica CBS 223.65]